MVKKLDTQVYKFLLDVVTFGYAPSYILAIALVHSRPARLLSEAVSWQLIDSATASMWLAIVTR